MRLALLIFLIAAAAHAEETTPWRKLFPPQQADVILQTQQVTVEKPSEPIVDAIPDHILRSNERFFTLNIENDKFGSGYDRDYTNGLRLLVQRWRRPAFLCGLD